MDKEVSRKGIRRLLSSGCFERVKGCEEIAVDMPAPPWRTAPPEMKTYELHGARMLSINCWKGKCFQCMCANMANVTIEYDWGKSQKHRFESFCYGPKSCKFYKMGKPRAVPYKDRGSSYDEGWLDEICTEHRGEDD